MAGRGLQLVRSRRVWAGRGSSQASTPARAAAALLRRWRRTSADGSRLASHQARAGQAQRQGHHRG
eukprot:scaffold98780_cov50-Phaeocystis_antarctica.AAC.2